MDNQPNSTRVVHFKKEKCDVYVGRPSKWGNPFTHIDDRRTAAHYIVGSRSEAVEAYREYITKGEGQHLLADLHELKGKTLGCWCSPNACHADILAELANELA